MRLEKGVRKEASSFFFFLVLLPPTRTFLRTHAYGRERAILDLSPIPRPLYALTTVHSGPFPLSLPFYSRLYFLPFAFCAPAYEEEDFLCSYTFFFPSFLNVEGVICRKRARSKEGKKRKKERKGYGMAGEQEEEI